MNFLFTLFDPRSHEFPAIITRGLLGMSTTLGVTKASLAMVEDWARLFSVLIGCAVGLVTLVSMLFSLYWKWERRKRGYYSSTSSSILGVVVALYLCGCASFSERQKSEAVRSSEAIATQSEKTIERTLSYTPQTFSTNGAVHEDIKITSRTGTDAGSRGSLNETSSVTIPFGVKLILTAVGLFLLTVAVWFIRRSSVAADAAFRVADNGMARAIETVETLARNSASPNEKATMASLLSDLNKHRGKLAGSR